MIKIIEPDKTYLYRDCIFETYKNDVGIMLANDVAYLDSNESLNKSWEINTVYPENYYKYIYEIDIEDYPEFFI